VVLTLAVEGTTAVLEVTDDGIGGVDEARGSGVRGLRDRVAAVDGTIEIHSPPGAGTKLRCLVPLAVTAGPRTDELAFAARSGR
jgi:signal transduction histidine kinase